MRLLPFTTIFLGAILLAQHFFAFFVPSVSKKFLQQFPRSRYFGNILLAIASVYFFLLVATVDLGEFSPMRPIFLIAIFIGMILFGWLVPDFLAVRSLGFLVLEIAHSLLEITFLQTSWSAFFLALLAYIWIVAGFIFVAAPYLLLKAISIVTNPGYHQIWNSFCFMGIIYGITLLGSGLLTAFTPLLSLILGF